MPYRHSNLAERFFSRHKHDRAVATRQDKHADFCLAAARIRRRAHESLT